MATENTLFPELVVKPRGLMPEGFRYEEDIISEADEASLAKSLATLDLKPIRISWPFGQSPRDLFRTSVRLRTTWCEGDGYISGFSCRPAEQSS